MPIYNAADSMIRAFQTGLMEKRAEEDQQVEQERKKIEMNLLQHRIKQMKLEEQILAWNQTAEGVRERAKALEGLPAAQMPDAQRPRLKSTDLSQSIVGLMPSAQGQLGPAPTPAVPIRATQPDPLPQPLVVPGFQATTPSGFRIDRPEVPIYVRTQEQILAAQAAQKRAEAMATPQKMSAGETFGFPGEPPLMKGGAKPKTYRPVDRLVNGRPMSLGYDPESNTYVDTQGNPVTNVQPIPTASSGGAGGPSAEADADSLGAMLVSGEIAPAQLSKFGASFNKAMARANRISMERTGKPYNAARAGVEYQAAMRFVSSLNSPQMVRFTALARSVVNTISEVDRLAGELKLSGVTFANAVELQAKMKVLGNSESGQQAAQYLGAVYTLREEFANLINGGYAPTEPAFALANKQVNENFGYKQMHASLAEVQRLINYRLSAFTEIRALGVGPENPALAGFADRTAAPPPGSVPDGTPVVFPDGSTGVWDAKLGYAVKSGVKR